MMTRNDFELLARSLKAMYPKILEDIATREERGYRDGYNTAINQVCGVCSSSNPRFDRDGFLTACGHES
ncbi:MAG TPA: hypothetical protein ENH62_05830 [Marinobacter sp.]|uniref:Uncharacterized protein n=1 Tax=marine sediment metagenome TaxID=412755 RepID=A0A0F9T4G0_9ZZZZ|nr:hypothetical protein [Marinobacter sp.]